MSRQRLAIEAECSIGSIALFEGGYRPSESAVLRRIQGALDALPNDVAPAGNRREVTTSAVVGDGRAEA